MTELFLNPGEQELIITSSGSQVDLFRGIQQQKQLKLQQKSDFLYAIFLDNAEIQLDVFAESPEVKAQIFAFIPAHDLSTSSLKVVSHLQNSHSEIKVHLIAIQSEYSKVQLDGAIEIESNVEKVSGHLLEEVILLGNASYTSLQPVLNVSSPDVQASHGAKVHRIPQDKLFYMQSRGLDQKSALSMIIDSYLQQILGHFELSDDQKQDIYSFIRRTHE